MARSDDPNRKKKIKHHEKNARASAPIRAQINAGLRPAFNLFRDAMYEAQEEMKDNDIEQLGEQYEDNRLILFTGLN